MKVGSTDGKLKHYFVYSLSDSCKVRNGGCDPFAECTHDAKTFDVVCRCKVGYVDVTSGSVVKCVGEISQMSSSTE